MAACSRSGALRSDGRIRSSVCSRRRLEFLLAHLAVGPLREDADLALGVAERLLADAGQHHAALELPERLLERELAQFESRDDLLEFGKGGLEVGRGLFGSCHVRDPARETGSQCTSRV
jgi:hypothetical protein